MTVEIAPIPRIEADWLYGLLVPYLAELVPELPKPDPEAYLRYWSDPDHIPIMITENDTRVGFALIQKRPDETYELAEFCIVPEARRRGLGQSAVGLIFDRYPGKWILGVAGALPFTPRFWKKTLGSMRNLRDLRQGPPFTRYQVHSYSFRVIADV